MNVGFCKHSDKSVAILVLKEPEYVAWVLNQPNPSGPLARVQAEVKRLIDIFDSKPIQKRCYGNSCSNVATQCSVYRDNVISPFWWCGACDPHQRGAVEGNLTLISTYRDALRHCVLYRVRKVDLEKLITSLAQAKGLPQRVGEKQAEEFFKA